MLAQNTTTSSAFLTIRFPDQASKLDTLRRGSFPRAYSIVQSVVLARSVMREIGLMELGEPPARFHVNEGLSLVWQDVMVWSSVGKDRTEKTFKNHLAMVRLHLFSEFFRMPYLQTYITGTQVSPASGVHQERECTGATTDGTGATNCANNRCYAKVEQ